LRRYPAHPKTLGEHLRKKRIDMNLSMPQVAKILGLGVTANAIQQWESRETNPTEPHRLRILEFMRSIPNQPS
jgi:transcriptional regulator with XRE-family HTH domain